MNLIETSRRIYWRLLRLFGAERDSWNKQYESGVWSSGQRSPNTLALVTQYCGGRRLIEFGCGEGELPRLLAPGTFSEYLGFDIADVAVTRARERAAQAGLPQCRFQQADMAQWNGDSDVAVILAEECLYYLNEEQLAVFLTKALASLRPEGRFIAIVHSAVKHAKTLAVCRRVGTVDAEQVVDARTYLVLKRDDGVSSPGRWENAQPRTKG